MVKGKNAKNRGKMMYIVSFSIQGAYMLTFCLLQCTCPNPNILGGRCHYFCHNTGSPGLSQHSMPASTHPSTSLIPSHGRFNFPPGTFAFEPSLFGLHSPPQSIPPPTEPLVLTPSQPMSFPSTSSSQPTCGTQGC